MMGGRLGDDGEDSFLIDVLNALAADAAGQRAAETQAETLNPPLSPAEISSSEDLFTEETSPSAQPRATAKKPSAHYHGHRQRLREKFLGSVQGGAVGEGIADYELLELLLFLAIPQKDVKPLAKDLLDRFGSLGAVFTAPPDALMTVPGIKEGAAVALKTVQVACLRMIREDIRDRPILSSWDRLLDYCHAAMAFNEVEEFRLLFLDRKNRLIRDERQQRGTVDHTPIYAREVVKRALELQASAVIMVHNHPSGDPQPSGTDISVTNKIKEALRPVDIILHDHLIISRTGYCSFKADGLL